MVDIRDPLYGFISLSKEEKKLISTEPFQRLRRIRQLGTSFLIYPSAEHNRFAHSLGVMEVATRIFDEIMKRDGNILRWSKEEIRRNRQLLRLAALLHDVGHAPFSHVSDDLFADTIGSHEEMSARLILDSELTPIIANMGKEYGFSPQEVAGLITGKFKSKYTLLFQIFSSEIDADKMDYLLRDSHFAGVKYGNYDFHRVLQNITVHSMGETWELAVDIGTGLNFSICHYGPYSSKLGYSMDNLQLLGAIRIEKKGQGYRILPGFRSQDLVEKGAEFIEKYRDKIDDLLNQLPEEPLELELWSTSHYVADMLRTIYGKTDEQEIVNEVLRIKKDKFNEDQVRNTLRELRRLKLVH